ncbi:MAG: hypothetical protein ABS52_04550 [Gemmatimonadetes bacterium SCN 70-22]|nr:MAG: hypothetical protein ABS52_04550 [Gemmatimonadetes bacterium SCN 70-22]
MIDTRQNAVAVTLITGLDVTTRILSSAACSCSSVTAASVGTSPAQTMTASGSVPRSLLAHSQIFTPAVQWFTAASMSRNWSDGCFPATITFT